MEQFYCELSDRNYERKYEIKEKAHLKTNKSFCDYSNLDFKNRYYRLYFNGSIKNKDRIINLLNKKELNIHEDYEIILGLYQYYLNVLKSFIHEDSFLLIDDGNKVFIYTNKPLYYARKKDSEIYLSDNIKKINAQHIFQIKEKSMISFYHNNLKTL